MEDRPANVPNGPSNKNKNDLGVVIIPWEEIEDYVDTFVFDKEKKWLYGRYKHCKGLIAHRDMGSPDEGEIFYPGRKETNRRWTEFHSRHRISSEQRARLSINPGAHGN